MPIAQWSCIVEIAPAQQASATTDSPEILIAKYESYLRNAPRMKLVLELKDYITERTSAERLYKDQRTEVAIDARAHSIRVLATPRPVPSRSAKDELVIVEQVYTPAAYFKVGSTLAEQRAFDIVSRTKPLAASEWRSFVAEWPFMAFFGILPWDSPDDLPARLRRLPVRVSSAEGDADGVIRLSGMDADLSLEVWLDPALRYCPKRIIFERKANDPKSITYYAYQVERVQFVNGYPFPAAYSVVRRSPGGHIGNLSGPGAAKTKPGTASQAYLVPPSTRTHRGQVVEAMGVASPSPADFSLTTNIPDGVKVRMVDAPQVRYLWLQGQVVPATDPRALAAVRKASYKAAPSHPGRFWLATASFGLLGAVMAILLWRWRTNR